MKKRNLDALLTDEESRLFRETCHDVTLMNASSKKILSKPKLDFKKRKSYPSFEEEIKEIKEIEDIPFITSEEILSFHQSGVQGNQLKKLKQGHFLIESELDLHGMTMEKAKEAVQDFLIYSMKKKFRCISIIHGKGRSNTENYPILKNKVNHWLRGVNSVLAFHSAPLRQGGGGVVLILLKNKT